MLNSLVWWWYMVVMSVLGRWKQVDGSLGLTSHSAYSVNFRPVGDPIQSDRKTDMWWGEILLSDSK